MTTTKETSMTTRTTKKTGRPATGWTKWRTGSAGERWYAIVTLSDGTRSPWTPLPKSILEGDEAGAKAAAKLLSDDARNGGVVSAGVKETVEKYAKRWHDWRDERDLSCVDDDRTRMKIHVLPIIGTLDVRAVTKRDLERLVEHLDKRIASKDLGWKVAGMAWSNVSRMFADACSAKRLDLRVREDNPAENVQRPETGVKKQKQYLWPSEFLALVSCPVVPLRWRRLFALAVYTYARAGELAALRWEDVSFDNMTIHIHRNVDRVRKKRKGQELTPKNGESRRIPIEPALLPLLQTMHAEAKGKGLVVPAMPSAGMLSKKLKHYLLKAGVERAELFVQKHALLKGITFHDLKSTGVTWAIARGDNPMRVKQRAAHKQFTTTEGYIREAENLGQSFGVPFPPLPELVRTFAATFAESETPAAILAKSAGFVVGATGFEPVTSSV